MLLPPHFVLESVLYFLFVVPNLSVLHWFQGLISPNDLTYMKNCEGALISLEGFVEEIMEDNSEEIVESMGDENLK